MAQLPGRALAKFTIKGYSNTERTIPAGLPFIAPYNPTTFSLKTSNVTIPKPTIGAPDNTVQTLSVESKTLSVDLFLDGTGTSAPFGISVGSLFGGLAGATQSNLASQGGLAAQVAAQGAFAAIGVEKIIEQFYKVTSHWSEEKHQPNFLKINWGGGLSLKCKLDNVSITYALFNQLGKPLRATIKASFIEDITPGDSLRGRFMSPDLTKTYIVKAGDTLFNIAKREYDSEAFYLAIAEANDLKNYRRLVPGQVLILPPTKKDE